MLEITEKAADKLTEAVLEKDLTGKSLRVFLNGFG